MIFCVLPIPQSFPSLVQIPGDLYYLSPHIVHKTDGLLSLHYRCKSYARIYFKHTVTGKCPPRFGTVFSVFLIFDVPG